MPKYLCTVNAQIHITKEITDTIEINAPDEVQAEEDAVTAAEVMDKKIWLEHPDIDYNEFYEDIEFKVEDIEEVNE
tara:strand:- start:255 stop:482 length:228 start_codon:yes stop_codon:yes gene_type:complete